MSKEEILKYAAEAIEKQIPKKPNVSAYNEDGSLLIYECPSCASSYDVDYDGQFDYCPKCGQAIDWSEYEKTNAKWIYTALIDCNLSEVRCSECDFKVTIEADTAVEISEYKYCPNCGAKMKEV